MPTYMVNEECPNFCQECYAKGCENCELNAVEAPASIEALQKLIEVCTNTPEEKAMFKRSLIIFIIIGILVFTVPLGVISCAVMHS